MTFKHALLWAAVASLAFMGVAHAAVEPAPVVHAFPWGKYAAQALIASTGILTTVASALVVKYVPAAYRLFLTPSVIADAVHLAVATTAGAVKGQTLSVQTTNQVLAAAESYVIANEPKVAKWLGDALRPRILAMLAAHGMTPVDGEVEPTSRKLRLRAAVPGRPYVGGL